MELLVIVVFLGWMLAMFFSDEIGEILSAVAARIRGSKPKGGRR